MVPGVAEATALPGSNGDHTNTQLGLAFHSDSAFLRGMQSRVSTTTMALHQRRRDPGALRERHGQQPAQPALRHPEGRRGRLDLDALRLAELRSRAATRWRR